MAFFWPQVQSGVAFKVDYPDSHFAAKELLVTSEIQQYTTRNASATFAENVASRWGKAWMDSIPKSYVTFSEAL